jgi:hypothetical protein
MAGKKIPVETVLSARDVNTAQMWERLAAGAQHYHGLVEKAKGAVNSFQTLVTGGTVLAAGAGLVETVKSLTELNKELESTTNNLAGSIQVYKFANNYNDALVMADDTLRKIKADAAALPGTDTDFIRAFAITFPEQVQQGVNSLDEAIKRSNNLTAVLLTKGVDSGQIGRDLALMMRGHAGADVRSFMELKGQLGVKDAEEFNKLSSKERLHRMDEVIKKNLDGIKAFGNTWEAVSSTAESYFKNMVLAGSKPLFEVAKNNVKAMNDYLEPLMPKIEQTLSLIGGMAVAGGGYLTGRIGGALSQAGPQQYALQALSGGAPAVLDHLATAGNVLLNVLRPLSEAFSAVFSAVYGAVGAALPGLSAVLDMVVGIGGYMVTTLLHVITTVANGVGPMLVTIMTTWSQIVSIAMDAYIVAYSKFKPVVDAAVGAVQRLIQALHQVWEWVQNKLHFGSGASYGPEAPGGWVERLGDAAKEARKKLGMEGVNASGGLSEYIRRQQEALAKAEEKRQADVARITKEAAKNKRPVIQQDFRGSKFSIEQKFAQGFDPGRVLTAVREDAQKLAQRRLTSGNTPLFGQT